MFARRLPKLSPHPHYPATPWFTSVASALGSQFETPDVATRCAVVACCRICQVTAQDEVTGEDSTVLMLQDCEDDPVGISDP